MAISRVPDKAITSWVTTPAAFPQVSSISISGNVCSSEQIGGKKKKTLVAKEQKVTLIKAVQHSGGGVGGRMQARKGRKTGKQVWFSKQV